MHYKYAALLCGALCAPDAMACSMKSGITEFKPQPMALDTTSEGLKAPELDLVSVTRGIGARHSSCDDTGLLTIRVQWPRGTDYKLRDIGFEFRVISGESKYAIFPETAVASHVDGRVSEFVFMWRDGPPTQQQPIKMEVEVRAVTADNRRGPPARLALSSVPGS